ncbi:hypothetical protein [Nannocystis punicea]|uniref:Uncharacterized protein n=1 Tax=Nannocystis punicea TaxID=2995304 RepID=A0ABY7H7C7_9BACT|nr:hypothetical protein [Nannocystis poenicansa]WAS95073.1 hypothetical protein O0S08_02835 [Nannocystis poenicansa]
MLAKIAASEGELDAALNPGGRPFVEAVAPIGTGVFEALRDVMKQILGPLRAAS